MDWMDTAVPTDGEDAPPSKARTVCSKALNRQELQNDLEHKILSMQSAQMIRLLQATAWHSYIVTPVVIQSAAETNQKHADKTRGQSGHSLGPPHVQSYRSLLQKLIQLWEPKVTDDQTAKAHLRKLKEHLKAYELAGVSQGWQSIAQLRVRVTKQNQGILNYQLSTMLTPQDRYDIEHALAAALIGLGGEVRPGGPPRSDMERKLQAQIDDIKTLLAKK
jgi:hypothetical protein